MRHIVQKQILNFSASSRKLMREWEFRVQDILDSVINTAIEESFDKNSTAGEYTVIDHVEIDIGSINRLSRNEIREKVLRIVGQQLGKLPRGSGFEERKNFFSVKEIQEHEHRKFDEQRTAVSAFVYFLIHGRLPWWVDQTEFEFNTNFLQQLSKQDAQWVANELVTNRRAMDRLVYQFDPDFIALLLTYFNSSLAASILLSWQWLNKITIASSSAITNLRLLFWRYWIQKCLGEDADKTWLHAAIVAWIKKEPQTGNEIVKLVNADVKMLDKQEQTSLEFLGDMLIAALSDVNKAAESSADIAGSISLTDFTETTNAAESSNASLKSDNNKTFDHKTTKRTDENEKRWRSDETEAAQLTPADEDEDDLYCEAAGLVLLHPFLKELFRETKLWDESGWRTTIAQHQAVLLMTWLAWGEVNIPEYHLTIPKMLCGMLSVEPLDTTVELDGNQLQSATELLEAVIKHWKALGNISVGGLREGFIMRDGKLIKKDNGWQLVVEKKAIDILLNRLPWGISIVRLPWMANNIYVEWI